MKHLLFLTLFVSLSGTGHAQLEWTPYAGNPILSKSVDPNATSIYAPSVVMHGGKYHLYYTRKVGPKVENLGHAVSDDGLTWTAVDSITLQLSGTATRFDSKQLGQASLISEGDTLKMWYWGSGPHGGNIGYAWSLDGKDWTRVEGPATDKSVYDITLDASGSPAIACPNVIRDGGSYKMWYSRVKVVGATVSYVIGHATSPDGLVWTKVAGSGANGAVLEPGAMDKMDALMTLFSCVVKDGNTYRMWYSGVDSSAEQSIGYATSPDGIAWTKVPGALAGDAVVAGTTSTVMKSGAGFKMWYIGEGGMYYATSGLPVRIRSRAFASMAESVPGAGRFDSRGRRIGNPSRRFPGLSFLRP